MRFLFVGDTHGAADLEKLRQILLGLGLTRRGAIIHCVDLGAPWVSDDDETLTWWRALSLKKIICLGNHENYGWILKQLLLSDLDPRMAQQRFDPRRDSGLRQLSIADILWDEVYGRGEEQLAFRCRADFVN